MEKEEEVVRENVSLRTVWKQCYQSPWLRQTQIPRRNSPWQSLTLRNLSLIYPKTEATLVPYCPVASVFPDDFRLFLHVIHTYKYHNILESHFSWWFQSCWICQDQRGGHILKCSKCVGYVRLQYWLSSMNMFQACYPRHQPDFHVIFISMINLYLLESYSQAQSLGLSSFCVVKFTARFRTRWCIFHTVDYWKHL